jgi:hypothetical protein
LPVLRGSSSTFSNLKSRKPYEIEICNAGLTFFASIAERQHGFKQKGRTFPLLTISAVLLNEEREIDKQL